MHTADQPLAPPRERGPQQARGPRSTARVQAWDPQPAHDSSRSSEHGTHPAAAHGLRPTHWAPAPLPRWPLHVAAHLKQPVARPALYVSSVNVDPDGTPIEYACTWFAGDRVTLTVDHDHGA